MKRSVAPSACKARHDGTQPVDVTTREARGGLVEQQDARLAKDGAGDLDLLLDREVERADLVEEVDIVEVEGREMLAHPGLGVAPAHEAQGVGGRVGDEHVVQNREVPDQRHLLEGRLHAEAVRHPGAREPDRAALDADRARVGQDQTREQLDDRRLAGAVLAQKRMDIAGRDAEGDVIGGHGGAERLPDPQGGDGG